MTAGSEKVSSPFFSDESLPNLRKRIRAWFTGHGRDLPWRQTSDPYSVWVSEIMLQQTTTETVLGYYAPFLKRFPRLTDLADADLSEVLHYWEGLGYYRRAHLLHQTAKIIRDEYGGIFPTERSVLEKLPGLGRYTVGAVLSFALDRREPILEANTTRLYARIMALRGDLTARGASAVLWDFAQRILPSRSSGKFNQALIDLGHTVCLPRVPRCCECPCRIDCRTAREGLQDLIPVGKKKPVYENRTEIAWLFRRSFYTKRKDDQRRFLFIRYPMYLRWGGLWDFPRFLLEADFSQIGEESISFQNLRRFLGTNEIFPGSELKVINHVVTHYKIKLVLCDTYGEAQKGETFCLTDQVVSFAGGNTRASELEYRWLTPEEAGDIPLSSTGRKLVSYCRKFIS